MVALEFERMMWALFHIFIEIIFSQSDSGDSDQWSWKQLQKHKKPTDKLSSDSQSPTNATLQTVDEDHEETDSSSAYHSKL